MATIAQLANTYPELFHIVIILASLAILVKSADIAVFGISNYAKRLGLSDYIVGILVVSLGSSMPELVSSITGATLGESSIIMGTIIGSNVAGLTLVVGSLALVGRKLKMESRILEQTKIEIFLLAVLPFILLIDGRLSRFDGLLLLAAFFGYLTLLWNKEGELGSVKKDVKLKKIWRDSLVFLGCLIAMLLSGRWLVFSSIKMAHNIGVSPYFISLVVIGIGASAPDITVGIKSVIKGHQDVGFGNALGSLVTKSLLFLGVIAVITPIEIEFSYLISGMIFLMLSLGLTLYFVKEKEIDWKKGLHLIFIYLLFVVTQLFVGK